MAVSIPREFKIRVWYRNRTGRDDFTLVVFQKPRSESHFMVWRSICAQSSARFWYSSTVEVAANYSADDVDIECGPFPAAPDSVWMFTQEHPNFTGRLKEELSPSPHTEKRVVTMHNSKPVAWCGRTVDCLLYRDGYVCVQQASIPPGSVTELPLSHELGWGVVRSHLEPGTIIDSLNELQYHWSVDMQECVGCKQLVVTLEYCETTGEYSFTSSKTP